MAIISGFSVITTRHLHQWKTCMLVGLAVFSAVSCNVFQNFHQFPFLILNTIIPTAIPTASTFADAEKTNHSEANNNINRTTTTNAIYHPTKPTTTTTTKTTTKAPSFEIVVTLLHDKFASWSGRFDDGAFLMTPEVADIPVNIFLPAMIGSSSNNNNNTITNENKEKNETSIVPPPPIKLDNKDDILFPYLANRAGPVHYFSILDGRKTQEVTGYLHFIVDRYDDLPDVTIFLHSGPQRHGERILENIRHVIDDRWTPEQISFLHLNYEVLACRAVNKFDDWHQMWTTIGFNGSHHPNHVLVQCCAQFMVSKERIHLRPKSLYQNFLHEAYVWASMNGGNSGYSLGLFAEFHWHLIFGQPPILPTHRRLVSYMLSNWSKPVHPDILNNPIPNNLPYSDSMKVWYEKYVANPDSYFPNISTDASVACADNNNNNNNNNDADNNNESHISQSDS